MSIKFKLSESKIPGIQKGEFHMHILTDYAHNIKGMISFFDRIIIKGYNRQLCNSKQFGYFLSAQNVLYKDYPEYAQSMTEKLCAHVEKIAVDANRPSIYLRSPKISKEETALELLNQSPIKEGLVGLISTVEVCSSMGLEKNKATNQLYVGMQNRKCKFYYLYFIDKQFGWMHIKIQTWFPFMVQIYINGREYLSRMLDKESIGYIRFDNTFTHIDDLPRAKELVSKIDSENLSTTFDAMIRKINCHCELFKSILGHEYYWCLSECEYATDIMFNSRRDLEEIYPSLVEHAFFSFSCEDIMSFFGRKTTGQGVHRFQGEIASDLRKRRKGIRIKHRMKSNQVKMYDKDSVLRIETTINDPKEFKIYKDVITKDHYHKKAWVPMGKSIANMYRYAQVSLGTNMRYLNHLSCIYDKKTPVELIENISEKRDFNNRPYSGYNLLNGDTIHLFEILSNGSYLIHGFTNKDIRNQFYKDEDISSPKVRNKTTRLLRKLIAHGLIWKTPKTMRYHITVKGRKIIGHILYFINNEYPKAFAFTQ